MAQIDAKILNGSFDASDTSNVDFTTGTFTPFSNTWTSSNFLNITALGYLGDFGAGLTGTVHGIFIESSFNDPMLSIVGLNNSLTDFIDAGNVDINHEKFWNTVLAGETEVFLPTDSYSLTLMGDFVRVATGQTLTGARDTFTGNGLVGDAGGALIGDALVVNAGGTLFGGADRFIDASTSTLIGDVGNSMTGNSGIVFGGDDVFITFVRPEDSIFGYDRIIGDVEVTTSTGITHGGDDTILMRNTGYINLIAGDGETAFGGSVFYGGDDTILAERTTVERAGVTGGSIVGDLRYMYASGDPASTVEGGNDTITLDSPSYISLVSGDFDDFYHDNGAMIRGGNDLLTITSQFHDEEEMDGNVYYLSTLAGDAQNLTLSSDGEFVGGADTLSVTDTNVDLITGDAINLNALNGARLYAGDDVITVTDDRGRDGSLARSIYGDMRNGSLSSDVGHIFGDDTIAVNSLRTNSDSIEIFGDAHYVYVDGGETLNFGDDDIRMSGIEDVRIWGDAFLSGSVLATAVTAYNGDDYIESGAGNDVLYGDLNSDSLTAGPSLVGNELIEFGGNDTLDGGLGNDTLDGGDGIDTASFASVNQSVMVFLDGIGGGDINAIGQGNDVFTSIENVIGSSQDDVIVGDMNDNMIEGGAGADNMVGNTAFGMFGDTLSYKSSTGFVNVSIETGYVGGGSGSHAIGDTFLNGAGQTSFRNVIGSDHDDLINGDDFNNYLYGGAGDDYLRGRGQEDTLAGGGDTLDGGAGSDWADYADNFTNINVSLASGFANGGPGTDALGDVFISIENVRGTNFGDRITGNSEDNIFEGRLGSDSLFGGAGEDTADYRSSGTFVNVSLFSGFTGGGVGNHASGDSFNSIENLFGSAHNDLLNGDGFDNILRGRAGGDTLRGNGGIDTADYTDSAGSVNVSLLSGFAGGGAGSHAIGDTFDSIENLRGSAFGDTLNGSNSANVLEGGLGADMLRGNGGIDTASYANSNEGVTVSLATNFTLGGHAAGDTFTSIENILGSDYHDFLNGDAGANYLEGGGGSDILRGRLGADTLDGGTGPGFDIADYGDASGAVNISLQSGYTAGSHAAGDVFISIEGLNGSTFNDILSGDDNANDINGGLGNDSLRGFDGNDYFFFDDNFGNDTIGDFSDGDDMLVFDSNSQVGGIADLTITTVGADALVADNFGNTVLVQGAAGNISDDDFFFEYLEEFSML